MSAALCFVRGSDSTVTGASRLEERETRASPWLTVADLTQCRRPYCRELGLRPLRVAQQLKRLKSDGHRGLVGRSPTLRIGSSISLVMLVVVALPHLICTMLGVSLSMACLDGSPGPRLLRHEPNPRWHDRRKESALAEASSLARTTLVDCPTNVGASCVPLAVVKAVAGVVHGLISTCVIGSPTTASAGSRFPVGSTRLRPCPWPQRRSNLITADGEEAQLAPWSPISSSPQRSRPKGPPVRFRAVVADSGLLPKWPRQTSRRRARHATPFS